MNEVEQHEMMCRADESHEYMRPFVLLKPHMAKDGNAWICLYGDNIQEGVCGIGNTPDEASRDFDKNWKSSK